MGQYSERLRVRLEKMTPEQKQALWDKYSYLNNNGPIVNGYIKKYMKIFEELFDRILVCLCSTFPLSIFIKVLGFTIMQQDITLICVSLLVNIIYEIDNWKSCRD